VKREDIAAMGPLQRKALLEDRAEANPTLDTLNRVLRPFGGAVGLVFPRMEQPPAPTADVEQRRASLRAALAGTRRRKRAKP
jgi:hypothetical protein